MSHSIGVNQGKPLLVKTLLDSQFTYQDTTNVLVSKKDSNFRLLKKGYLFQKRSKKGPSPGSFEYFELICLHGGVLGGPISTEVITEPYIIKQILLSCFNEFANLNHDEEVSLSYMFENLKCIGVYEEICTKFTHEYFKFTLGDYKIHPKVAIVLQYDKCIKAKFNPNFDPFKGQIYYRHALNR